MEYKLIVAGGRGFTDSERCYRALDDMVARAPAYQISIVSGMAQGADSFGCTWAQNRGALCYQFPAKWDDFTGPCVRKSGRRGEYNALAGHNRNRAMGDFADGLLAFWDGRSTGTRHMIEYMRSIGKPVEIIHY